MNRGSKSGAMLVELIIVLLFFSVSTAITLQLFAAAHDKSEQNRVGAAVLTQSEDVAERFYASGLSASAFFAGEGWVNAGGGLFIHETPEAEFAAECFAEVVGAGGAVGTLERATLIAKAGDRVICTLPLARYMPKEVAP